MAFKFLKACDSSDLMLVKRGVKKGRSKKRKERGFCEAAPKPEPWASSRSQAQSAPQLQTQAECPNPTICWGRKWEQEALV